MPITPDNHRSHLQRRSTQRRIRALVTLGWPIPELATRLHITPHTLIRHLHIRASITPDTTTTVHTLYQALADVIPIWTFPGSTSRDARAYGRRYGWVTPLAWDDIDTDSRPPAQADHGFHLDEIKIELATTGDRTCHLNPRETEAAVRQLHRTGLTDIEIAVILGLTDDGVRRARIRIGLPTNTVRQFAATGTRS